MEMSIKWRGFDALIAEIRKMGKEQERKLRLSYNAEAMNYAREAKKHAPVDKNMVKPSIRWAVEKHWWGYRGIVGTNVEHAIFSEFGTRRIKVGTPERPRTVWPAKSRTGTTSPEWMPWLRSSWLKIQGRLHKALEKTLE